MKRKAFITIVMNKTGTGLLVNEMPKKTALAGAQNINLFSPEEQAKSEYVNIIKKNFVLIPKIV
jgi:hypothetical protein